MPRRPVTPEGRSFVALPFGTSGGRPLRIPPLVRRGRRSRRPVIGGANSCWHRPPTLSLRASAGGVAIRTLMALPNGTICDGLFASQTEYGLPRRFAPRNDNERTAPQSLPCAKGDSPGGGNVTEGDKGGALVAWRSHDGGIVCRHLMPAHDPPPLRGAPFAQGGLWCAPVIQIRRGATPQLFIIHYSLFIISVPFGTSGGRPLRIRLSLPFSCKYTRQRRRGSRSHFPRPPYPAPFPDPVRTPSSFPGSPAPFPGG